MTKALGYLHKMTTDELERYEARGPGEDQHVVNELRRRDRQRLEAEIDSALARVEDQ